jgi:hypothetical protein
MYGKRGKKTYQKEETRKNEIHSVHILRWWEGGREGG